MLKDIFGGIVRRWYSAAETGLGECIICGLAGLGQQIRIALFVARCRDSRAKSSLLFRKQLVRNVGTDTLPRDGPEVL